MALYEFEGKRPLIADSTFIHPQAVIIGEVEIGAHCYVGAGAVIRGDNGKIIIGCGSNIQENAVLHAEPESIAILEDNVLVGHSAIVHGPCLIKNQATIGMGALVSPGCEISEQSVLAAGSVLPPGKSVPPRQIAMGNPARLVKNIDEKMINDNRIATHLYQQLASRYKSGLKLISE